MQFHVKLTVYPNEVIRMVVDAKDANSALIRAINAATEVGYSVKSVKLG